MNSRGAKQLLLGLVMTLFSLMLVFAGFVFLLLDAVPYFVNLGSPIGGEVRIIVLLALIVGLAGLAVAYLGFGRAD